VGATYYLKGDVTKRRPMRIRNLSSLSVPSALWHELAAVMRLGDKLPGAIADDLGMYGSCQTLSVTVRPRRAVPANRVIKTGSYTYGRISLFPCRHCTSGSMTQVVLHELFHAWLHQYHDDFYTCHPHCDLAERFANAGFAALGGALRSPELCGSYRLAISNAMRSLPLFRSVANTLLRL